MSKLSLSILALGIILALSGSGFAFYKMQKKRITDKPAAATSTTTSAALPTPGAASGSTQTTATKTASASPSRVTSSPATVATTAQPQAVVGNIKTVEKNGGIQTKEISTQNCRAYAPDGWSNVENAAAYAFGYDAYNAEQSLGASYLVTAVTVDPYYNFYRNATPEQFIETTMTTYIGYSNFSWLAGPWDIGSGYTVRMWKATKTNGKEIKALSQYITWDMNGNMTSIPEGNSSNYIIVLRQGAAETDKWNQGYSAVVYDVATSIRCQAQVKQNYNASSASESYTQKGSSDDRLSEARREATMGYENVYDTKTGEHYEAPTSAYNEVGPYGGDPGYYKQVGNDYIRLEKGFGF